MAMGELGSRGRGRGQAQGGSNRVVLSSPGPVERRRPSAGYRKRTGG